MEYMFKFVGLFTNKSLQEKLLIFDNIIDN